MLKLPIVVCRETTRRETQTPFYWRPLITRELPRSRFAVDNKRRGSFELEGPFQISKRACRDMLYLHQLALVQHPPTRIRRPQRPWPTSGVISRARLNVFGLCTCCIHVSPVACEQALRCWSRTVHVVRSARRSPYPSPSCVLVCSRHIPADALFFVLV